MFNLFLQLQLLFVFQMKMAHKNDKFLKDTGHFWTPGKENQLQLEKRVRNIFYGAADEHFLIEMARKVFEDSVNTLYFK